MTYVFRLHLLIPVLLLGHDVEPLMHLLEVLGPQLVEDDIQVSHRVNVALYVGHVLVLKRSWCTDIGSLLLMVYRMHVYALYMSM